MELITDNIGPLLKEIIEIGNASPEKLVASQGKLLKLAEEAFDKWNQFEERFKRIRDSELSAEEKVREFYELIDVRVKNSHLDIAQSMVTCERIYKGYWDKLDAFSQHCLAVADFLFKLFSEDDEYFSPSVVEYGRAIENELIEKIYSGYVLSLCGNIQGMIDRGSLYRELKSAVHKTERHEDYYISARIMVKYLTYLSDETVNNPYNEALKRYLLANSIDEKIISSDDFTLLADDIMDRFRNSAAHPGKMIDYDEAKECREKTKKVLKRFMSAVKE